MVAEEGGFVDNADSYADDLPYWDASFGDKPQLIVPYTLYAEGHDTPRMMSIGLHCRLVGRPGRIASLARILDYMKSFDDVWVARHIDMAEHWQQYNPAAN